MEKFAIALLLCTMSIATAAMEGVNYREDWWAYQWYTGEPFLFKCQNSGLNITANNYVKWDTPTAKALSSTYNEADYEVKTTDNIRGVEILVKKVDAEFHGVYTCIVYDNKGDEDSRVIYGLNIHDVKYRDMMDKYRHSIIVAVVATAVFIVPFATTCFVWHFWYEEVSKRKLGKSGKTSYVVDSEMKEPPTDGIAATVMSSEGEGAYDNPNLSTQL
ncbi:uncharacterized protein LOC123556786 [Mercenaria mercenaria]|uniref:uncharacterized protein LOC123556786 n=1 Tax=Mercenaria mercenaria TaxID=6596 RepID=UPI00234F57E1|nr:uncharacterized protein LOC123556786 [Mercenaria mercenaria]